MFIILILLLISHFLAAMGWYVILSKFNIDKLTISIPFYGTLKRFILIGYRGIFVLYAIGKVCMTIALMLSYCMYIVFINISIDQLVAKPAVIIFLMIAYLSYLVCALCNYTVNKKILLPFEVTKKDIVFISFFPAVFLPRYSYKSYRTSKIQTSGSKFKNRMLKL